LLIFLLSWAGAAEAGAPKSKEESAQRLATAALDALRRGEEEANTPESQRRMYEEGLALARRALQVDNSNADAHFAVFANHGRLLQMDGVTLNAINLFRAKRELERTLELDPHHSDALAAKGGMYRQLPWMLGGDLGKAEEFLTRAIAFDPDSVGARIELAETYREMGHRERSLILLEQAARIAERQGRARKLAQARELLADLRSTE
jgi:tetratricopeptide (TPR) repeat protein